MRLLAGLLFLLLALASPVASQQAGWRGPYLTGSSGQDSLVLIATGDPSPGATLTYGRIDGRIHRIETVVEVDCATARYRTGPVQIYRTDPTGGRGALVVDIAGMSWRPLSPQDTIIRDYFCSGLIDGDLHATVQPAFSAWTGQYGP